MQVEGILGTIPQRRIEEALQAVLPDFQRCFLQGLAEVDVLGGALRFYFHVALDGHVAWVIPRASNVGHRATELCLLARAKRVRFPQPKGGGPAEFAWGLENDANNGAQPPLVWPAEQASAIVAKQRASLEPCATSEDERFELTVFVAPGGSVLAAGAAVATNTASEHIDCVLDAVRAWTFPDPGSSTAKLSLSL
ncbi:MAG: hypothetical protein RL701_4592 [Pseudomonadota bacterium]|jgi:hypothetical protein